jgi:AdoMet-dependent rRNA methyltransferase SPB1
LDKYYHLAKEKGYRARAAFKLVQLNKKYGFLQQSRCLIDLCAAPGSWMQVAAETMPIKSLIVGVDLDPIKPIPKTISFQGDITTDKCRATLRGHLKTWKADTVIHDGAPNVGTAWVQDAFSQNELVLASLKLATEFLAPNGCFVTKVFRSKDSQKLEWVFKQLFEKVEQTKPPSSRNVSAETFYVCRGYKAPKNLDPRFLDANYAFAEVKEKAPNMEAKVFNPEKKKRKRDGYEEGDWTQFHEVSVTEFIESEDPIQLLGSLNRLHFREENNKDDVLKIVDSLPETTEEVKLCTQDLKVLGRKEFKMLLRWRLKARRVMGLSVKKAPPPSAASKETPIVVGAADPALVDSAAAEGVTVEPMDDELRLQAEIAKMKEMADKTKRKERRKENERKQKEITRLQMHMITPTDIGIEAAENGENTFKLRDVDKHGLARELSRARMHTTVEPDKHHETEFDEEDEDEDGDQLEAELDQMYQQYTEKREDRSAKVKAKRARMKARGGSDDEFEGFGSDNNDEGSDSDDGLRLEDDDDEASSDEEDAGGDKLMTDLQDAPAPRKDGLTNRAANFFEQDIFKDIGGVDDDVEEEEEEDSIDPDSGIDVNSESPEPNEVAKAKTSKAVKKASPFAKDDEDSDSEIEYVDTAPDEQMEWEDEEDLEVARGKPNIDIITAEAMTLAHKLATGKITKQQLLDDNFNKISLRDVDGLPEWFLDDENQHSKTQRPISKEAANAIKEKTKALNARPIKKVREAKARKTMRAARRVEKLKKKSEGLAEGDDLSEKDKATNISKIMAKAKKGINKKPQPKLVVAGGFNKGKGRPRGIKGKYKMVDARMKKETRALKRIAKKKK